MSHLIPSIGLGVSFRLVEGRYRLEKCLYHFVPMFSYCNGLMFLLGVIGWQIADFWKAAHVLKNFHLLVPKRACMDLNLCCTPIAVGLQPGLFLSCSLILLILCCNCSRVENAFFQQITSRQADSQDLASPSNMPYNNPKI